MLHKLGRESDFLYLVLPPEVLRQPLTNFDFRLSRTLTLLHGDGICTLEALIERSVADLRRISYFSQNSVEDVQLVLAAYGWHLSPHDQNIDPLPGDDWVTVTRPGSRQSRTQLRSRLHRVGVDWLSSYYTVARAWKDLGLRSLAEVMFHTEAELLALPWDRVRHWTRELSDRRATPQEGLASTIHLLGHWNLALLPTPLAPVGSPAVCCHAA
jgi:hypothetical protein